MNPNLLNTLNLDRIINKVYVGSSISTLIEVQELWSGYGSILRLYLKNAPVESVIVKLIKLEKAKNHPRGWNTDNSHKRKLRSYEVEKNWYSNYAEQCLNSFRMPNCLLIDEAEEMQLILLEDLDASGFAKRKSSLSFVNSKVVISWLAHFHANFLSTKTEELWEQGSYWHLATRKDEFDCMQNSKLKEKAAVIDQTLRNSKFQTLIHGDAKLANFCFSEDLSKVAAVDFQYVGKGCGIIDLAYFMGSCFTAEECAAYEDKILEYYFEQFKLAYPDDEENNFISQIEAEWRSLYPFAVADFNRFLIGWMPNHSKLNTYTSNITNNLLSNL